MSLPGRRRAYATSVGAGLVTFAALYVIDVVLAHVGLNAEATILDELLLGTLVALLVLLIEIQHLRELRLVMAMNHHIRNALQTIVYANAQNTDRQTAQAVSEAAERIDWALREFLPGSRPAAGAGRPNRATT